MKVEQVFTQGPLPTHEPLTVSKGNAIASPPKPLMLVVPSVHGDYPVLLFLHGFFLQNNYYTQLLQHIASHGYITIAPQMEWTLVADATGEIEDAVAVTKWLHEGLSQHLPKSVQADLKKVAIAGHSRGGKVAFGAALDRSLPSSTYVALLGIDPPDGTATGKQIPPPILTYKDHSFALNIPTLIIGSGLGPLKADSGARPCAPAGVNHVDFFRECVAPAYHFVAVEYGHMDFLDDKLNGAMGMFTEGVIIPLMCKNGPAREPMRRLTGGIIVAFLNAWVSTEEPPRVLDELVANPSLAPVKLETPQIYALENVHA